MVPGLSAAPAPHPGASALAGTLLNAAVLVASDRRFRLVEVEFYGQGGDHFDPFAHAHPLQREAGRWYFHRAGPRGGYRGGSYAGLDLACGSPGFAAGFLLRSLRDEAGGLICGPALCVRALLQATGAATVAELDALAPSALAGPLRLEPVPAAAQPVFATPRVGLTLKKADHPALRWAFIAAPYRFTTEPRLPKGRAHTALALLRAGLEPEEVRARTGADAARLLAAMQAGGSPADFAGIDPGGVALARLCGAAWNTGVPRPGGSPQRGR